MRTRYLILRCPSLDYIRSSNQSVRAQDGVEYPTSEEGLYVRGSECRSQRVKHFEQTSFVCQVDKL